MNCLVCGNEVNESWGECSVCHFPVYFSNDTESLEAIRKMADDYKKQFYGKTIIHVKKFWHKEVDGKLELDHTETLKLAAFNELQQGKTEWNEEKFARFSGDVTISVQLQNPDGKTEDRAVTVQNPDLKDFWHIGVTKTGDTAFKLSIGNGTKYEESKDINII